MLKVQEHRYFLPLYAVVVAVEVQHQTMDKKDRSSALYCLNEVSLK